MYIPELISLFQFSTTSLATAAVWEFENIHKRRRQLKDWFHHSRRKYVGNLLHIILPFMIFLLK